MVKDDIGSTDDTALLCHTNKVLPKVIGGDWFDPDGTKVGDVNRPGGVPGVERNRGPHVIRLKRSSDGTPPEGMYKCVVRDTTDINQTVYVGIGSYVLLSSSMLTGDSVTRTNSIFKTSEVDVTVTSSTRTKDESTPSSSHLTPTQTVLYTSSEGTPTPTPPPPPPRLLSTLLEQLKHKLGYTLSVKEMQLKPYLSLLPVEELQP